MSARDDYPNHGFVTHQAMCDEIDRLRQLVNNPVALLDRVGQLTARIKYVKMPDCDDD